MKKILLMFALALAFTVTPVIAAPSGGHGGGHGAGARPTGMARPPVHHASVTARPSARPHANVGHAPHVAVRPHVAPPPRHHHIGVRPLPPPMFRPYRPIYRPYPYFYTSVYPYTYYGTYYPTTYTTTTYYEGATPVTTEVVVQDNYAGINTAANVVNTAANVAATIKYLSW